jgi:HSP20 family protein
MVFSMSEVTKPTIAPTVFADHDNENYYIQIELPGVKKEDIELQVSEQGFCIKGPREDIEFSCCYQLAHEVVHTRAKAKFENGLLDVVIPLTHPVSGIRVKID